MRKKQNPSSSERPFSRMYTFFSLKHGDKWSKTGTLFKPLGPPGYPRHVTSTVAKKERASAARGEGERTTALGHFHSSHREQSAAKNANHVSQGKESKVEACGSGTGSREEVKLRTKKRCYLTSTPARTLSEPSEPSRTSGQGLHTVANRVAWTVDGGETMAQQLQALVDAL